LKHYIKNLMVYMRRKKWPKIVLVLLALELGLRIFFPKLYSVTYYQSEKYVFIDFIKGYREDPEVFWLPADGFAHQIEAARGYSGANLIYTFGGSIAYGAGALESFSHYLRILLNGSGRSGEVINFALPAYSSYQSLHLCRRICRSKVPQIVLLCNAFNDASPFFNLTDRAAGERNKTWPIKTLYAMNRIKLFAAYRNLLLMGEHYLLSDSTRPAGQRTLVQRSPLPDYRQNLMDFARLAREEGFTLLLLTQPMPTVLNEKVVKPYFEVMAEVAQSEKNVYLVDIRPLFAAYRMEHHLDYLDRVHRTQDELFYDTACHPTDLGHRLYAQAIYQSLVENNLLK